MNQFEPLYTKAQLIVKSLQNELTDEESIQLNEWIESNNNNNALFTELSNEQTLISELEILSRFQAENDWDKLKAQTLQQPTKGQHIKINRTIWLSVAATLIIGSFFAGQFLLNHEKPIFSSKYPIDRKNDIQPGGNKATLQLADGTTITLNDSINGFRASQHHVNLLINKGAITYQSSGEKENEILFNTVSTPKGGQYELLLEDGTRVWLNAASSLKYPTAFSGNERIVELTGEGYFEVAHNTLKPFRVIMPGLAKVEAIGTSFNINSYSDEHATKATLIEGKVKVSFGSNTVMLNPGQQANVLKSGEILLNNKIDVSEVIAWKNGQFIFNSVNIESIMRQISRWYEIEVVYNESFNQETFSGIVSRKSNLSDVLKIMEEGGVKFRIEGKKIYVY